MDPLFGLPCINESRAMDNARHRNIIADKLLAQKFESLDLAKRSASGRLLNSRSDIEDFRETIDINPSLHNHNSSKCAAPSRRGPFDKKAAVGSMSLREFDKIINEAKDRKNNHHLPHPDFHMSVSAKESNPNSFILKKENTVVLNTFDSDSSHIVDLEQFERCLPINRQKHAMRDAWDRATTEDIYYKRQRAHNVMTNHTPQNSAAQKWQDRHSAESPTLTKPPGVKPILGRRKRTL